jgi:signal transduction histidine kinase
MGRPNPASVQGRLITVVGLAVAVAFLGSLVATVAVLDRSLKQEAREELRNELQNLIHNWELGGLKAVRQEVEVERLTARDRPFYVRVATDRNKTLFSNVPREWQEFGFETLEERDPDKLPTYLRLESSGAAYGVEIISGRTDRGLLIQVGGSTKVQRDVIGTVATTFGLVAAPSLVAILVILTMVVRRLVRPIGSVSAAVRDVLESGDYSRQVVPEHSYRETDELVAQFNSLMSKVNHLIGHLQGTLQSLAHEIRTPMTRLRAQMELAVSHETSPDELRRVLSESLEESAHVISLLQRFLDASEAESGVISLNCERVELKSLFSEIAEAYRLVGEEKSVSVVSRVHSHETVTVDPVRMRQALSNLLDNAVKFSPPESTVELSVERTSAGRNEGDGPRERGQVTEVRVRDQGPGIPPDQQERIWSYQVRGLQNGNARPETVGYGLGLTIVRAIAEAHGGSVAVRSPAEGGAEFLMRIPDREAFSQQSS